MPKYYEADSINRSIGACTARGFLVALTFARRKFVIEVPGTDVVTAEQALAVALLSSKSIIDSRIGGTNGGDRTSDNYTVGQDNHFRLGDVIDSAVYRDTEENRTTLGVDGIAYAVEIEHAERFYELTDKAEMLGYKRLTPHEFEELNHPASTLAA